MHRLNCLVAIGGDLRNKIPRMDVTVPELQLLQAIHGRGAVTDIKVLENARVSQLEERERLMQKYPKHAKTVVDIWRDNGKFVSDVRELKLSPALFAANRDTPYQDADRLEMEAIEKIKKTKAPRKPRAKKVTVDVPDDVPETTGEEPGTDDVEWPEEEGVVV